jgi:hypothetical protein
MSIVQTTTTSFVAECLEGVHDILTDTLMLALYADTADLSVDTTAYTATGEITGTGYLAGGVTLTGVTIGTASGKVFVDFVDPTWDPAAFTARGGLIYNSSKADRSVAVLDFGADKTAVNTFTITLPANTADAAIIRFKQEAVA